MRQVRERERERERERGREICHLRFIMNHMAAGSDGLDRRSRRILRHKPLDPHQSRQKPPNGRIF